MYSGIYRIYEIKPVQMANTNNYVIAQNFAAAHTCVITYFMKQSVTQRIRSLVIHSDRDGDLHLDSRGGRVREVADLEADSLIAPAQAPETGPFNIAITVQGHRLLWEMRDTDGAAIMPGLVLSLRPYRRLIRDYFLMVESYEQARRECAYHKLEAIDAGRKSVHDEAAQYLQERLGDKLVMDFETARRLFTLFAMLEADIGISLSRGWRQKAP